MGVHQSQVPTAPSLAVNAPLHTDLPLQGGASTVKGCGFLPSRPASLGFLSSPTLPPGEEPRNDQSRQEWPPQILFH